jgi:hypothetical protein
MKKKVKTLGNTSQALPSPTDSNSVTGVGRRWVRAAHTGAKAGNPTKIFEAKTSVLTAS